MKTVTIEETNNEMRNWIGEVNRDDQTVLLTSSEDEMNAVMISETLFWRLVGAPAVPQKDLLSPKAYQDQFGNVLHNAGYETTEQIVQLCREVRREIYEEENEQL